MSIDAVAQPPALKSGASHTSSVLPHRRRMPLAGADRSGASQSQSSRGPLLSLGTPIPRPQIVLIRRWYQLTKRIMDVVICLALLPLVLPVLAVCAIAIFLDDRGPVVFTQLRTGRGGNRFRMFKFRTMRTNAEQIKQQYAHLNELQWPDFKITNDPRITRVGRMLRRTSLDELPQIFNVLLGQMSLVGPRPTSFAADTYALWQMERLEVLPGVTGLWQISGRSELDFDDRLRLDIEYIENRSLMFDMRIMLRTLAAVWAQRGAC